jgi:hypothetical protein
MGGAVMAQMIDGVVVTNVTNLSSGLPVYNVNTGEIIIEKVSGDIVINASATEAAYYPITCNILDVDISGLPENN